MRKWHLGHKEPKAMLKYFREGNIKFDIHICSNIEILTQIWKHRFSKLIEQHIFLVVLKLNFKFETRRKQEYLKGGVK